MRTAQVRTQAVASAAEAFEAIKAACFDCIVLDLSLPATSVFDLVRDIRQAIGLARSPILLYAREPLSRKQQTELQRLASVMAIDTAESLEALLYKSTLLLHRDPRQLPPSKQALLDELRRSDPGLAGSKVLIVDDDARNVFALTSLLERHGMQVLYAGSGPNGIRLLEATPDVELVLMDVMMPEMDGYETMQRIRQDLRFQSLPIIALTAKAMKGDRQKCLEAGATDYIAKPVDNEHLLSLLRVWLTG
jgi:CheY-like chemotaxis protein